jgi:hypothetical protein
MQRFSRFVTSRSERVAYSPIAEDTGLRTKSGLVAGLGCDPKELKSCTDKCAKDPQCYQKCARDGCEP